MIDEKKIEAAKEEIYEDRFLLNGEEIVFNNDEKEEMFYKEDIKEAIGLGAKWAINEFLKDLWHPASEKPVPVMGCNNGVLVELNETKKPITLWKREYLYENISKHGNRFISRWLYIDDLFQKEGGEHD